MIETMVFDIGETITRDDRYWNSWADWLGVPRHTVSALVGAVVAQGRDNADALRLVRSDIDLAAEYAARAAAGRGEHLDETDLYRDVRPALGALREREVRVVVAATRWRWRRVTCCVGWICRSTSSRRLRSGGGEPSADFSARVWEVAGVAHRACIQRQT